MPKKVSLDELDIEEPSLSEEEKLSDDTAKQRGFFKKISRLRFFVIVSAATLLFLSAAVGWWFFVKGTPKQVKTEAASQKTAETPAPGALGKVYYANLTDLFVPLDQVNGERKVLLFDIACEIDPHSSENFRKNARFIRIAVYKTVKMTGKDFFVKKDAGNILRQRIKTDINALLGEEIVKDIFFTRFIVL